MINRIDFIFFDCRKTFIIIVLHLYNNNIKCFCLHVVRRCVHLFCWNDEQNAKSVRQGGQHGPLDHLLPEKRSGLIHCTSFFFMVLVGHIHVVFGPMWDLMCIVHLVISLHEAMICLNHVQQSLATFHDQTFTYSMCRCSLYQILIKRSTQKMNCLLWSQANASCLYKSKVLNKSLSLD